MRSAHSFFTILFLAVLAGCVPSLHELYTEETLVFDPALVGCWQTEDGQRWYFTRQEGQNAYHLVIEEEDKRSIMQAHLADLDGDRYLDLFPDQKAEICTGQWYKYHLLGVHTFLKVERTDPNLVLSAMNPDATEALLRETPVLIPHEIVDDRVVLTGSPQQIQDFLKNPGIREKIFGEPAVFIRCAP